MITSCTQGSTGGGSGGGLLDTHFSSCGVEDSLRRASSSSGSRKELNEGVWVYFSVSFYGGFGVGDWGLATYSCIYFKIIHCYGIFHTTFIGDGFVRLGFFFTDEYVLTATSQRCKHQSTQGEQGRGYQPSNPILLVSGRATSVGPATVRPR
jgi:hypothetical protein